MLVRWGHGPLGRGPAEFLPSQEEFFLLLEHHQNTFQLTQVEFVSRPGGGLLGAGQVDTPTPYLPPDPQKPLENL